MKKDKIFKEGKKKNCQCQKMRFNILCILQLKNETFKMHKNKDLD